MKPNETPEINPEAVILDYAQTEARRERERQRMLEAAHEWRQMGTLIECQSCPFRHGFSVAPGTQLVGIEDGKPLLEQAW